MPTPPNHKSGASSPLPSANLPAVVEFEWLYNQYNDSSPFPTPNVSVLSPVFFLGLTVHNFLQTSKSSFLTCSSKVDFEKLYLFFDLGIFPSNTDAIGSSYSFNVGGVSGSGFFSFGVISPSTAIILFYVPLRQGICSFNLNFIYNNQYKYYTIFCTLMSNKHLVVV